MRASILLVDDRPANLVALQATLEPLEHRLVTAASGEEALRRVLAEDFAVILLDVEMPGLDGPATAALIHGRKRSRYTPIIFLTAHGSEAEVVARAYEHGAVDYIVKPYDAHILRSKVAVFVELFLRGERIKVQEAQLAREAQERAAQAEAERQRENLHRLFMQAPAAIAILRGPDHVYELSNPLNQKLAGDRALVGRPVREALPEAESQGLLALIEHVYRTGEPFIAHEARVLVDQRDGLGLKEIFLSGSYQPLRDAAGRIEGIMAFAYEVTDQVRARHAVEAAQHALVESGDRLRLALRSARLGTWDFDPVARVLRCDDRCKEIFGLPPDAKADYASLLGAIHPADSERALAAVGAALDPAGDGCLDVEVRVAGIQDGVERWIAGTGQAYFTGKRAVRFLGTARDVTDAKRAEQERALLLQNEQEARQQAEAASRLKDEFLATVSHELRTPLAAILGWSSMLQGGRKNDPAAVAKGLEVIDRNARAQRRIIDDILDVSRIVRGQLRIHPEPVDLEPIAMEALDAVRPSAAAKDVQLVFEGCHGPCRLLGDPERLRQILWNLLSNAVKFTASGGRVALRISYVAGRLTIWVQDTGEGIPPEFLPHVFERFRQADSSSTRSHGGLGLGLAIVRHLVEMHGGTVRAESAGPGRGSTFTVALPVRPFTKPIHAPAPARGDGECARREGRIQPGVLTGARVLVVEDEPDARELVELVLSTEGAVVLAAESAEQALSMLPSFRPDVLVSDIGMPGHDGYWLMERVRAVRPDLSAIALTAYARVEDEERAHAAGFRHHLAKPVDPGRLVEAVERLRVA